jgi:glycosyltransferase involved in cell wall biosynthesis
VSVIIPVYNQAGYLRQAIDSVLAQTYTDFELIVVDDGSTDDTPAVIARFGGRIRAFRKPNGGFATALNLGIRSSRAAWVAWLSADDLWTPEKLARQMTAVRNSGPVGLVFTDFLKIGPDGSVLERVHAPDQLSTPRATFLHLLRGCYVNGSTVLIPRAVLEELGLFGERERLAADYDLFLRIAARHAILHVPEPLVLYRVHPGQGTVTKRELLERETNRIIARTLRATGGSLALIGLVLCLRDRILSLGWRSRRYGGPWYAAKFYLGDFLLALVRS